MRQTYTNESPGEIQDYNGNSIKSICIKYTLSSLASVVAETGNNWVSSNFKKML